MSFELKYETGIPVMFCGRLATKVPVTAILECYIETGWAEYKVLSVTLSDYHGNDYEPSGEEYDMVCRMIRESADKDIRTAIWDKADWEETVIRTDKDGSIYA